MNRSFIRRIWRLGLSLLSLFILMACGPATSQSGTGLSGAVRVDGSSTVFPITEAVAEEFQKLNRNVRVTVGLSGTGGGFKKFTTGEIDISDASRPIEQTEIEAARKNGVEYLEIKVALDGLSVVVNRANDWVDCLTTAELKKVWEPGSQTTHWNQVRPGFPDLMLRLYGPGTDSGTFDYFTLAINGKEKASRADYTASEDDNVLVQGVMGDRGSLGYFGYAYYAENQDKIKVLGIDSGKSCVKPSDKTVKEGTYSPLSRPLFIYVSRKSLQRPEVREFVRFYLAQAPELVPQVGYTPLPQAEYDKDLAELKAAAGS